MPENPPPPPENPPPPDAEAGAGAGAPVDNRRNHYRVLHVQPEAPLEVIKASYRTLMSRLRQHPDLGGSHATAAMINEAYAVLSDPERREAYDRRLRLQVEAARGSAEAARRQAATARAGGRTGAAGAPGAAGAGAAAEGFEAAGPVPGRSTAGFTAGLHAQAEQAARRAGGGAGAPGADRRGPRGAPPGPPPGASDHPARRGAAAGAYEAAGNVVQLTQRPCPLCGHASALAPRPDARCTRCNAPLAPLPEAGRGTHELLGRRDAVRRDQHHVATVHVGWPAPGLPVRWRDLSLTGLSFYTPQPLAEGQRVHLIDTALEAVAEVVACRPQGRVHVVHGRLLSALLLQATGVFVSAQA